MPPSLTCCTLKHLFFNAKPFRLSRGPWLFLIGLLFSGAVQLACASAVQAQDTDQLLRATQALKEGQELTQQGRPSLIHKGIERYQEALTIFRTIHERTGEVTTLLGIAMAYSSLEEWGNALEYLNQARPLAHTLDERFFEALTLSTLASTYSLMNQHARAINVFNEALSLLEGEGGKYDSTVKGFLLTGLGTTHVFIGEQQKGFGYLEQALALKRSLQDASGEAQVLRVFGATYLRLGQKQKALDYFTRALGIYRTIKEQEAEAQTLQSIGAVHSEMGDNQKALDYYNQVLALHRSSEDRSPDNITFKLIGDVYSNMGETARALDYYNQSLQLKRDIATLNNIGLAYGSLGEFQKALELYEEVLSLAQAENNRRAQASALANIGAIYSDLGEEQRALDYYNQALPLVRAMSDPSGEAAILGRIGGNYLERGEKQKGLEQFLQALGLFQKASDRVGEVHMLINIGGVYREIGERQKALDYYGKARSIASEVEDSISIASILNNTGEIYRLQGDNRKALDYYNQALAIVRAAGDRQKEAATLSNIAVVHRVLGNLAEARAAIELAVAIIESLRTKVGGEDLRASYFAKAQDHYEFYIDLLMASHKLHPSDGLDAAALQMSEKKRARSLMETLAEAHADIRQGVAPQLLERERSLQQQLNARALTQQSLRRIPHTDEQLAAIQKEIKEITGELQQVQTQIRQTSPRYATLTQPVPLTLSEIQTKLLDADTLLLEYALGREKSYLWAVTQTSLTSYELPGKDVIEDAAREAYVSMADEGQSVRNLAGSATTAKPSSQSPATDALARLSQMLLAPVATQLGKKRLLIVGDGALQYIPFSALPILSADGGKQLYRPLILEHEIVNLPSASTLAVLRFEMKDRKPAEKILAVLADPVFAKDDERIKTRAFAASSGVAQPQGVDKTRGLPLAIIKSARESGVRNADLSLTRLPGTRREAEQILALIPSGEGKEALDFEASRATATDPQLGQYRYLHFATHGFLNSLHPELSGIVLTLFNELGVPQDGFLRAHEIFNLKLSADVVVLSACQTGLGKEVRGEGLVGLTRGFMYAGVPRVVVSLWSVSDAATAELMTGFYRGMLIDKLPPAKALQAAQIKMFNEKRFRSPFYWAAFTLQGEWR